MGAFLLHIKVLHQDDRKSVNVWVSSAAKNALYSICAATGETQAQAIERMILAEHP